MKHDDLEKPMTPRAAPKRRGPKLDGVALLALAAGGALAAGALWAAFVSDPLGGEPLATASIERRAPAPPAGKTAAEAAAHAPEKSEAAPSSPIFREGVTVVRPGDPMPKSGPVIIRVPGADDGPSGSDSARTPASDPAEVQAAMLEDSRFGKLPRIATDGRRPLDAYARKPPAGTGPRVVLVVAGLGTSRDVTTAALKSLPREVTLAFSPYASDVGDLMAEARKGGHETMIQIPMEPFAYPQNDPGPQTLLTSLPAAANLERLRWALGRASGYVGVAPLAGARFLQADEALAPMFTELARRGLMFAGSGQRETRVGALAQKSGLPSAAPAATIDQTLDAAAIDAALADLERDAKANGVAVGFAGTSPLTLKRIEAWSAGLAARGVALAPVSAALKPQGPS